MHPLSREEVLEVDRRAIGEFGVPGVVLMENAGRGAAEWLLEQQPLGRVAICCGRGNNGGDGFVVARHLDNRGVDVLVLLFCSPDDLRGDAAVNLAIVQKSGLPLRTISSADEREALDAELASVEWIVDALLGTGARGELREPWPAVIRAINGSPAKVLAVDLPSGLDCDTGRPLGECVRANLTATFVATKLGFQHAAQWTGEVRTIDIGAPRAALPW